MSTTTQPCQLQSHRNYSTLAAAPVLVYYFVDLAFQHSSHFFAKFDFWQRNDLADIFPTCRLGAKTSTPSQGEDANICPRGYYCEEGTDESESCPAGTFSNISGKAKVFGEGWSKNVSLQS